MVVQLQPTPEQARILKRTLEEHTACFNEVARIGFMQHCRNEGELHKQTYYPLRAVYPDLPAQLVCAARVKATEAVKSTLTWQKKHEQASPKKVDKAQKQGKPIPVFKPVKCPHSQSLFHCRSCGYQLNADYNASLNIREKHLVSLANLGISSTGGSSSSGLLQPPSGELQAPAL